MSLHAYVYNIYGWMVGLVHLYRKQYILVAKYLDHLAEGGKKGAFGYIVLENSGFSGSLFGIFFGPFCFPLCWFRFSFHVTVIQTGDENKERFFFWQSLKAT